MKASVRNVYPSLQVRAISHGLLTEAHLTPLTVVSLVSRAPLPHREIVPTIEIRIVAMLAGGC